jgi:esterase/lipase
MGGTFMTQRLISGLRKRRFFLLISGLVIAIASILLTPWNIAPISSHPRPAKNYTEALRLTEVLRAAEPQEMNPLCRTQLMTHGKKAYRAIILVHGYTSDPQEFRELGQRLYDLGYNVLIAPLPHHGLADLMTDAHARLTAEELATYADQAVDIGHGLGKQVIMMGISAGGVTTAWAAQNRNDIDLAVIISPALGFKKVPTPLTGAAMNIYTLLPDALEWWDPVLKEKVLPAHDYPRYSRHALVQILRLGFAVQAEAQIKPPAAKKIVVVFNANDSTINNEMTTKMMNIWKRHHANLTTYEFNAGLKLPHDLIDPAQPAQRIDIVYPRLMKLISQ